MVPLRQVSTLAYGQLDRLKLVILVVVTLFLTIVTCKTMSLTNHPNTQITIRLLDDIRGSVLLAYIQMKL